MIAQLTPTKPHPCHGLGRVHHGRGPVGGGADGLAGCHLRARLVRLWTVAPGAEAEWDADIWLVIVWLVYPVLYLRTLRRRAVLRDAAVSGL